MIRVRIAAVINSEANPFQLRASSFHSTPVLERKRRTHWDTGGGAYKGSSRRFNIYAKRNRKQNAKQALLRNVSSFAEQLFQSWQFDRDEYDPSASRSSSWFRQDFKGDGLKGGKSRNKVHHAWNRREFQFFVDDYDDFEVDTIFRSAFGGNRYSYFSFINEEPQWRESSRHSNNHRFYGNWKRQYEEEYDSTESDNLESDVTSDRLALGLSSSGPLSLEDVKNAYRACALKWHPDRHHGSSKVVAEEKFKLCSAAYQSLCDQLALS